MRVIGVTGMPGSGKGVVAGIASKMGFEVVRMGDIIRDEAQKRNFTVAEVAVKLREEQGKYVVAERCVMKIKQLEDMKMGSDETGCHKDRFYMIEGIRSPYEVEIFKKNFKNFKVIAVHSTPKTRFKRLKRRMRFDDSSEISEFEKRDERELKFGIGDVIATSDYMVMNERSIHKFKNILGGILQHEMRNEC
jgi:Dephospho-CoA kinase